MNKHRWSAVAFGASVILAAAACGSSTSAGGAGTGGAGAGSSTSSSGAGGAGGNGFTLGTGGGGGSSGACNPACAAGLDCVNGACVGIIDFETLPGGAPLDGLAIDTQFKASYGVTFGLDKDLDGKPDPGVSPVLAKVGDPATAYSYDTGGVGDTAAPGQPDIGMFFLTDDGVIGPPPSPLIITYSSPVAAAYGQILDVDGPEGWTVESRDANDAVLDSIVMKAGDPNTGDGVVTPFSFKHATADIHSLRLRYTGDPTDMSVGLAFDNFSPSSDVPPPK